MRTGGGGQLRQQSHLMSTNHRLPQMSGDQFLNQFSSALALSRPGVSFLEQSQSKEGGTVYLLRSGVPFSKTIPFNSEESESLGSEVMRSNHRLEEMSREDRSNASSQVPGQGGLSSAK